MRQRTLLTLAFGGAVALSGCESFKDRLSGGDTEVERAIQAVNVIDESNMNDIMLTVADPNEAVAYFKRTAADNPDRIDVQRGLAESLIRAKRPEEGVVAWARVAAMPEANNDDRISHADALVRAGKWDEAEAQLGRIPPTVESFDRYRLEAMMADKNEDWKRADSFYETAVGLTNKPAGVYNNWGFSKLTRGDYQGAEKLFGRALTYNDKLFTAKNNLVLARAAQRKYDLPIITMTQTERAQLLHTSALSAIKQGDVTTGKSLLQSAIDTHPQHFDAAARSLRALDASGAT